MLLSWGGNDAMRLTPLLRPETFYVPSRDPTDILSNVCAIYVPTPGVAMSHHVAQGE